MNYLLKPNIIRFNSYIRYFSNKTGGPRSYLKYSMFYEVPYDEQYEQRDFYRIIRETKEEEYGEEEYEKYNYFEYDSDDFYLPQNAKPIKRYDIKPNDNE